MESRRLPVTAEWIMLTLARATLGLTVGVALALIGYLVGWMVWSPLSGPGFLLALRGAGAAVGAALGSSFAWSIAAPGGWHRLAIAVAALAGGFGGAFGANAVFSSHDGGNVTIGTGALPVVVSAAALANLFSSVTRGAGMRRRGLQ